MTDEAADDRYNRDFIDYYYPDDIDLDSPIPEPTLYPCPRNLLSLLPVSNFSLYDEGQVYCNSTFDRVLCWPTTPAGEIAIQPCPPEFAGIKYLKYGNASKVCYPNGTWELKTDYNQCHPEFGLSDPANIHNYVVRWLYYVGFTVSIVSCVIALFIFLYFKEQLISSRVPYKRALQCVRNKIHCHLIVTFVLRNLLWLIMNNTFPIFIQDDANYLHQVICKGVVTLFNYAQVTNFFWMLVEGLYLHFMVVWAFSIEMIKFWWYIVLGWCAPAVIVLIWVIVKLRLQNNSCWLPEKNSSSDYEYIYIVPVLLVLVVNVIFLISIVVVLITKLRATNTLLARQYKIAVKATVILLPLLGGTYILFICSPGEEKLVSNLIFIYFNTILQSTQVRATIQSRYNRWREGRTVSTRYTRGSVATSNGETLGLHSNFRLTNGISNGPAPEVALRSILRNDCVPDRSHDTLITQPRDEERGQTDDDIEGKRDVTLL
ncbi:hypothetical protein LSH36_369g01001 [Paralvinella palmiformis]|uniref:Uncharacterized protein n=1 Tax=Paralvinella palmiformis TaxID=53620 RepID=A0AAD9JE67_9ANNE|nr:hypothetical protein LSH36_369g01001 [Paralvinella palmiformis]